LDAKRVSRTRSSFASPPAADIAGFAATIQGHGQVFDVAFATPKSRL